MIINKMAESSDISLRTLAPDNRELHDNQLVYELENADSTSVGLVLRALYDGNDHNCLMESLVGKIRSHDRDIERMCSLYYQGFIESIRQLLTAREQAQKLKSDISNVDKELALSVNRVVGKGDELVRCRRVQMNIAATIDSLTVCLPVLETYAKLKRQMNEKRYYPALRTLEQLEHTQLPRVSSYRFSQQMSDQIPRFRDAIKDASMVELHDFLENVRKLSAKIGEVAMRHAAVQNGMDPYLIATPVKRKKRRAPPPPNPFTGEIDDPLPPPLEFQNLTSEGASGDNRRLSSDSSHNGEDLSAHELVDFSPVYRCFHIYCVLGSRETFENYYRTQRHNQAQLVLQPPPNMNESIETYKSYFQGIVGFFVIEDHLMNTANGLVGRTYLTDIYEMAISRIVLALRTHASNCSESYMMLRIKDLITLFSYTLRSYGLPVSRLVEIQMETRDQYVNILMKKWVQLFRSIFDEDNYHPILVDDQKQYNEIVSVFPYKDVALETAAFPKAFPFSFSVPKIYEQVKEFIKACFKFLSDFNLTQTEADDMVRKSANVLLTQTLSGCLSLLIKKQLGLLQLIQISINMNHLEDASINLEDFISSITKTSRENSHVARLQGRIMFKDARADAENQIYVQLNKKIDEFMNLANYDWVLMEPSGHASSYLTDLMSFLKSTFAAFTNLPLKVAQTSCLSACKHIGQRMMDFVLDEEVKQVSLGALQQFNLDLIQCEQFAASEPVAGLDNSDVLQLCFAEIRQLIDLFLAWDWPTYFHDFGTDSAQYLRVSPHAAISLLNKLREAEKKNVFAVLKKSERDKKRLVDTVLKQLKQLTVTNGNG